MRAARFLLGAVFAAFAFTVAGETARAGGVEDEAGVAARLRTILAGDHRAPGHAERDRYRHPVETLLFFGIEPGMSVVELWPGRKGWYTEILAPLLYRDGTLYAAGFDLESSDEYIVNSNAEFAAKLAAHPELYGRIVITELGSGKYAIAPPASVDRVLTFRNLHNWLEDGIAEEVFAAIARALKPGGVLGVVEHRADPGTPAAEDPRALSGYVTEARVIALAESVGLRLAGRSEINANPNDTKDYAAGVWALPPVLRVEESEREKHLAIGESDRMTLKFVKPAD